MVSVRLFHECPGQFTNITYLEPKMLFAPPGFARYDYNNFLEEAKSSLPNLQLIVLADIFRKHKLSSKSLEHQDYEGFLESKASSSSWKEDPSISPHDMVNVQFTSGSTGLPKSVSLSHYNIMNCGRHIWLQTRLTSEDRICCPVPLFHSFGMIVGKLESVPPNTVGLTHSDVRLQQSVQALLQDHHWSFRQNCSIPMRHSRRLNATSVLRCTV